MAKEKDFDADIGMDYELPEGAPEQGEYEEFQFYRHPAGIYIGFIGKLHSKFKDGKGKACDSNMPGANFDHFQLPLWILKFLGSSTNPKSEDIITITDGNLILADRSVFEMYYGAYISTDPKRLWGYTKMFEDFKIPGHPKYNIIQQSGKNMATKVMNYSGFPAYYGLQCKFALTYKPKSEKQTRYIDGKIEILDFTKRIPSDKLKLFEEAVDLKVKSEQKERAKQQDTYTPPEPAEPNFDLTGSEDMDSDLDGFIK